MSTKTAIIEGETVVYKTKDERSASDSRYRFSDLISLDSTWSTTMCAIPEIPASNEDLFHRVTAGEAGRLDLIAYRFYRNVGLWWVLAKANGVLNPFEDVLSGQVLRIPNITNIYRRILT